MKRPIKLLLSLVIFVTYSMSQYFVQIKDQNNPIVKDTSGGRYAGASWVDVDGDGTLDLFRNRGVLYKNKGSGVFEKIQNSGIGQGIIGSQGSGNSWADYDNDGDLDCYFASGSSALYSNDGTGIFSAVTTGIIGQFIEQRGWACAWGDYDNDGFVDLFITHPAGFVGGPFGPTPNHLLHNEGNGTFKKITHSPVTIGLAPYTVGSWVDFDVDGDIDLFIASGPANTTGKDYLYRNMLKETGSADFVRITEGEMATDLVNGQVWNFIDYDNDGDLDSYLTNYGVTNNNLYKNTNGVFTRQSAASVGPIVSGNSNSLANVWGDFDNDGNVDCFVTKDNGSSLYYRNNGDGTFSKLDTVAPVLTSDSHIGATIGDYDSDGDLDLYVISAVTSNELYRNETPAGANWLSIKLKGTVSNKAAIGATVYAKATISGTSYWQQRTVSAQNSFNGHNSLDVHFGLGDAAVVESLKVVWPSGVVMHSANVSPKQFLTITETEAAHFVKARFTYDAEEGQYPLHVQFTDVSSATTNPVNSWKWDFDNNGTIDATTQNPSWIYSDTGSYSVKLIAGNGVQSDTVLRRNIIKVKPQAAEILFNTATFNFGTIDINTAQRETTLFVVNRGKLLDSISAGLNYGTVQPESSLSINPKSFVVAPGDSQAVTYTIYPKSIQKAGLGIYGTKIILTSKKNLGAKIFEKPMNFRISGTLGLNDRWNETPHSFGLEQNFPNPFNPSTVIRFQIPSHSHVKMLLYDAIGREIGVLVDARYQAGRYSVELDSNMYALSSGIYYYTIIAGRFTETRKIVLIK